MSEIDWDKAPEGATHYVNGSICPFEKRDGDDWYYWKEKSSAWIKIYNVFGDERIKKSTMQMIERPSSAWSGEGLPPVGVVCEALYMGQPQGVVSVRYSGQCMILWSEDRNSEQCGQADHYLFKPIRTKEQIAADEREAAVAAMLELDPYLPNTTLGMMSRADFCRTLHDAGYRKP